MLLLCMSSDRNVQLLRCGTVQIIGKLSQHDAEAMCHELLLHLQINTPITPLAILNLVISAQLKMSLCLQKIVQSSANHIYEVELFPVALISKCHPAHVVFHNGKVILINVKTMTACKEIFSFLFE